MRYSSCKKLLPLPACISVICLVVWSLTPPTDPPSPPDSASRIQVVTYAPILPRYQHYFLRYFPESTNSTPEGRASPGGRSNVKVVKHQEVWRRSDAWINGRGLYPGDQEEAFLASALRTAKIVHVDLLDVGDFESGTDRTKWVVALEGGGKGMAKLIWEEKGEMKDQSYCNYGFEMPSSEIAAYHLHSVLGFHNTPVVTGRKINVLTEILPVASPSVAKAITVNASAVCVIGDCKFCPSTKTICSPDGVFEASISHWVPRRLKQHTWWPEYMPWSTPNMHEWGQAGFNNRSYCDKVHKEIELYQERKYYYDLFDFAVLDTLMYHFDSKHYTVDDDSRAKGLTVRLDHGRAFCSYSQDELHIFLAPIRQCCTLRSTTYYTLSKLQKNNKLSRKLKTSLGNDPLTPVLKEKWYPALERRLAAIMNEIRKCAEANGGMDKVLVM